MKKILNAVFVSGAIVCALIAFIMLYCPAIVFSGTGSGFTLSDTAFGCDFGGERFLTISFLNMLPFALLCGALAGLVVQLIGIFYTPKSGKKLATPVGVILQVIVFIVAGILFLLTMDLVQGYAGGYSGDVKAQATKALRESLKEYCELGVGAIVAAVFSFIGAGLSSLAGIFQFAVKD